MCLIGLSESGHGGRFEPCEEYKKLRDKGTITHREEIAGKNELILRMMDVQTELLEERVKIRAALQKAVDDYGKPGGPWNVPREPGTWIMMAKDARGVS